MFDTYRIVDAIERTIDAHPFCPCGSHTTAVWRDGVVWLECASLSGTPDGIVRRLLAAASRPVHLHVPIIEAPGQAHDRLGTAA